MTESRANDASDQRQSRLSVAFWQRLAVLAVMCACGSASASDWVFKPSYYSHAVAPPDRPLPSSRSNYRLPNVSQNPGFSVRGYHRINYYTLRNGRGSYDRTIFYRGDVEIDP